MRVAAADAVRNPQIPVVVVVAVAAETAMIAMIPTTVAVADNCAAQADNLS